MQNHARRCTHCMLYTVMQSMRTLHCIVNVLSGISSVSGRLLHCTVCCATSPLVSCCTVRYLASAPAPYFQIQPLFPIYYCILTPALPPIMPFTAIHPSIHSFHRPSRQHLIHPSSSPSLKHLPAPTRRPPAQPPNLRDPSPVHHPTTALYVVCERAGIAGTGKGGNEDGKKKYENSPS